MLMLARLLSAEDLKITRWARIFNCMCILNVQIQLHVAVRLLLDK